MAEVIKKPTTAEMLKASTSDHESRLRFAKKYGLKPYPKRKNNLIFSGKLGFYDGVTFYDGKNG